MRRIIARLLAGAGAIIGSYVVVAITNTLLGMGLLGAVLMVAEVFALGVAIEYFSRNPPFEGE